MTEMHHPSSLVRSVSSMGRVLRKQLWIWPIVAVIALGGLAWWVRGVVDDTLKRQLAGQLQALLDTDVTALRNWLAAQEEDIQDVASHSQVKHLVAQLVETEKQFSGQAAKLLESPQLAELRQVLKARLKADAFEAFIVLNRQGVAIASVRPELIGKSHVLVEEVLPKVLAGKATVSRPYKSTVLIVDHDGVPRAGVPTMFSAAPVTDDRGEVIACLGLRLRPERDFSRVFAAARAGESGETYAIDRHGTLLSHSRFDDQLKQIGLLVDRDEVQSILNLEIRDPQVDMTQGQRPTLRRAEQPLTRMAAAIAEGSSGVDVTGYRDYRGTPVVGAWRWLPEYGMGIATELDVAEAERPVAILHTLFWAMFGLLTAGALAIFVFTLIVARLRLSARRAAVEAKQLGQYSLDEKIGEGGMGVVYRGHHAMLRRPTAIKLLNVERTTDESIARFEREVQITSQLIHPNTIVIFDYGRTPEGVFYYAMEYLEGVNLETLVRQHGPQHEGRVIHILQQVCGSLAEAHGAGLVHRDIKPANLVLTQRGGAHDFVKVLDFGLVKALDSKQQASLTAAGSLTGTPLYLSPEAIQNPEQVDHRSDLYAVGAVGYFLVTGTPVFGGDSVVEICMKHVQATVDPPSQRLGRRVSPDLEALVLRCLSKRPEDRPQSAGELIDELEGLAAAKTWSRADARQWWQAHPVARLSPALSNSAETKVPQETLVLDQSNQRQE
jgi:serine/threonine protein kinase